MHTIQVILQNLGPDFPFSGGMVDTDYPRANPDTTGQVMSFNVTALYV